MLIEIHKVYLQFRFALGCTLKYICHDWLKRLIENVFQVQYLTWPKLTLAVGHRSCRSLTSTCFHILIEEILWWAGTEVTSNIIITVMTARFFHKICALIQVCKCEKKRCQPMLVKWELRAGGKWESEMGKQTIVTNKENGSLRQCLDCPYWKAVLPAWVSFK